MQRELEKYNSYPRLLLISSYVYINNDFVTFNIGNTAIGIYSFFLFYFLLAFVVTEEAKKSARLAVHNKQKPKRPRGKLKFLFVTNVLKEAVCIQTL